MTRFLGLVLATVRIRWRGKMGFLEAGSGRIWTGDFLLFPHEVNEERGVPCELVGWVEC